ncbi:neutral zinc metallopeptidase [Candidatus Saccharibacteria bacterium]|nr:MAG: neutral zinc metallopeptidase [Candidatus Saccharibacteria bacterium]
MALWDKIGSSGDVEDRRGMGTGGIALTGVGGLILFLAFAFLGGGTGQNGSVLEQILGQVADQQSTPTTQPAEFQGADQYETFTKKVLGSNNDIWSAIFQVQGRSYEPPKLVLFRSATQSGCGYASSAVGPHYCPEDQTIYLDETFFDELQRRYGGSSGDVAQAYVIAHEAGHHVQNQLGTMDEVTQAQQDNPDQANTLSEALELQADCYAGIWMHSLSAEGILEPGEIHQALSAAAAVGDDHIQKIETGTTNPETWTHGSSSQRTQWFNTGYTTGKLTSCNTFQ